MSDIPADVIERAALAIQSQCDYNYNETPFAWFEKQAHAALEAAGWAEVHCDGCGCLMNPVGLGQYECWKCADETSRKRLAAAQAECRSLRAEVSQERINLNARVVAQQQAEAECERLRASVDRIRHQVCDRLSLEHGKSWFHVNSAIEDLVRKRDEARAALAALLHSLDHHHSNSVGRKNARAQSRRALGDKEGV